MTNNPAISLVFVNYHSAWQLSLALKSLFSHEKKREMYEIIVVNNDPYERLVLENLRKTLPFLLVHSKENKGFASGANLGAKLAKGTLIGFINPDTLWCRESLTQISELFFFNRELGIFGMTLINKENGYEKWSGGKTPSLSLLLVNNILPEFIHHINDGGPYDWISGGGLFIRKSTFEKIGGFDESFFLYFEDVDLCLKVKKEGYQILREPYIPLMHTGGKSSISTRDQKKHFYSSQRIFFEKNRPIYESKILNFLHLLFY